MAADKTIEKAHLFEPTILRSYDIRGQVGNTLFEKDAFFIGAGLGQIIRENLGGTKPAKVGAKVAVGRDGRLTSPALAAALIDGLVFSGCHVLDIGVGPTPMLYFADRYLECHGAIQVTGSHNPPDHNGFKMVYDHQSFFGEDIQKLSTICASGLTGFEGGAEEKISVFDAYIERVMKGADFEDSNIVWDAGNGAAGPATDAIIARAKGQHKGLFTDIDGHFPNHHPNPVDPKTLAMLREEVLEAGADCGIGFDGDGDRIGVVDAKGRHIAGDVLTAYLGLDILKKHPGSDVIFDSKSSRTAMALITEAGGKAHLWKTGHSHMKAKLREMQAPLAGEMSGHIFIADDYYGFDDALFVAVRLITSMVRRKQETGKTLTDFIDTLPAIFATPECHIPCPDDKKFGVIETLAQAFLNALPAKQINLTDGVRITNEAGWCLIRASNTEGALVVRAEGQDAESLAGFITLIKSHLAKAGLVWDGP